MKQVYVNFRGDGRIVLVNDNYLGSWIWGKMVPLLQRLGYDVDMVELCCGVEGIQKCVKNSPQKVSLVGHGDGGRLLNQYISQMGTDGLEAVVYIGTLNKTIAAPPDWPIGRKMAYDIAFPDWKLLMRNVKNTNFPLDWKWQCLEYPEQYYVACTLDEMATLEEQEEFLEQAGVKEAYALESTHFPQLGRCTELCYIIHHLVCRIHGEETVL